MTSAYPHPASRWCSPRCAQPAAGRHRIRTGPGVLRDVERTFDLSVRGPGGWAVDAAALGHGLPQQTICLYAMRTVLRAGSTGFAARDAAWRYLVDRARHAPEPWRLAALGMAVPALGKIVRQLAPGDHDVECAAVEGFLAGLADIDLDQDRVFPRLYNKAHWCATVAVAASRPAASGEFHHMASSAPPPAPYGHADMVLARLHHDAVISFAEAHLIGRTRLESVDMREYADEIGATYRAVRHRRMRAEQRVVSALHAEVTDERYVGRHRKADYTPRHRAQSAGAP